MLLRVSTPLSSLLYIYHLAAVIRLHLYILSCACRDLADCAN